MQVPTSIFRYQRFTEWLRPLLLHGEIYFPLLHELNDPCEYCYRIDTSWNDEVARSQIKELLNREPSRALKTSNQNIDMDAVLLAMRSMPFELLVATLKRGALSQSEHERRAMIEAQVRIDAQTIGICCFTENGRSSYMSHFYAGQHSGICLEFSTRNAPFSRAMPVSYQQQPPELRVIGDAGNAHKARMFVKATDWTQEREWRIVNHRERDGAVHKFSPGDLVSISLCPSFSRESLLTLKGWLAERSTLGHQLPACFRFVRMQESYEFHREPIDLGAVA